MATNTLGVYNPIFYAQEALIQLENALGIAGRIHRGYEEERRTRNIGETISIRKPSTFTAQDAPSTAQDVTTETVNLTLSYWREVKFELTDKELAFTTERIINDHIRPAAYALANDIDSKLALLYKDIPWFYDLNANPGSVVTDITQPRKVLFDNGVPLADAAALHYMVDGTMEANLLANAAFGQWQGAGDQGATTQRTGALGVKYGFGFFANQNVQTHTPGTASTGTLALDGAGNPVAKGTTTITLDAVSVTGTLVPGDTFVIAGNAQRYSVTNTVTAATNAFVGVTITPALVQQYADDAAVTVSLDTHVANMAFHRNAFALAMAPLPDMAREMGARVESVLDPKTGLAIRARMFYVGDSSKVVVALDVLYGIKTLDPNLAVRGRG